MMKRRSMTFPFLILVLMLAALCTVGVFTSADWARADNAGSVYYISADGTSQNGLDINDPMSYKTALSKRYYHNDSVLFRSGDTFYGTCNFGIEAGVGSEVTVSSYGEGALPVISTAKIVTEASAWNNMGGGVYSIDLTDTSKFSGSDYTNYQSCNVGYMETADGTKYYNRRIAVENLFDEYDFCCDDTAMYVKSSKNPYDALGTLILAVDSTGMNVANNTRISNLNLKHIGGHAVIKRGAKMTNVHIKNCVIEDIGGSVSMPTIMLENGEWLRKDPKITIYDEYMRFGNGIEFWCAGTDIVIENNIIRNCFETAVTPQGTDGEWRNIVIKNNVFVANPLTLEFWSDDAAGTMQFEFCGNLSVNQGRGWGRYAHPQFEGHSEIVIGQMSSFDSEFKFKIKGNTYFNSFRVLSAYSTVHQRLSISDCIDGNTYYLNKDTFIYESEGSAADFGLIGRYFNKETNASVSVLEDTAKYSSFIKTAETSDDIAEILTAFENAKQNHGGTDEPSPTLPQQPNGVDGVSVGILVMLSVLFAASTAFFVIAVKYKNKI